MDTQIDRFLDIAQRVSASAQQDTLSPDIAVQFCKWVLPALLVELEVAKRVSDRLDASFPTPEPVVVESVKPKARKTKAAKRPRKKRKEVKHGGAA